LDSFPTTPLASACGTVPISIPHAEVFQRNWVTATCYMNIDPGWLDLAYYVNPPLVTIPNIPRGYQLNQFTINLYGELASSIEFVYTDSWLQVYMMARTSSNRIITDEISLLDNSLVVFYMDQNVIIDASDSMYGAGNNGRDCIQQSDQYDYNLLNCFFQNDSPTYVPNLYLAGTLKTSGIARNNDKFNFNLTVDNSISFSLTAKPDIDFSYQIQTDGYVCPQLVNQITRSSGCLITLAYLDPTKFVVLSPQSGIPITSIFNDQSTKNFSITIGTWTVLVNSLECFILDCQYTIEFNVVQVTTPNVQILSNADKLLTAQVYYTSEATLAGTVSAMDSVIAQVSNISEQIASIKAQLDALNFNVVDLYPYHNYSKLRDDVTNLVNQIPTSSDSSADNCSGPWNSIQCWFQEFASILICIAVLAAIVLIGYLICVRGGLWKKLIGKAGKVGKKNIRNYEPEYRAD